MSRILGMNGLPLNANGTQQTARKEKPITKAQAGAIITSELDLAIEQWNLQAKSQFPDNLEKAHLFEISFNKYEYSEEAKEKSSLFGYAKLSISVKFDGKETEIYNKGRNFKKENELDNTNGYYPEMVIDCMGFLLASGLMYNLAITNPGNNVKQPKGSAKVNKPGAAAKS